MPTAWTPPAAERDRLRTQLHIARCKLAAMGSPAHDTDANLARRRHDLKQQIVHLEAALGVQMALPDVAAVDETPIDLDAHDQPLTLDL